MPLQNKKNILITGATGFIGSYIVKHALALKYEVYVAVRKTSNRKSLEDLNVNFLILDFSSETAIARTLTSTIVFDTVIHNAGVKTASTEEAYKHNNVDLTKNLCAALQKKRLLKGSFIFISSLAALGPGEEDSMACIAENRVASPLSSYGKSKLLAEKEVEKSGLKYTIIRPTAVFGKGGNDYKQLVSLVKKNIAIYLASPKQLLSFIHADDLARLIFLANTPAGVNQVFNASDTQNYTLEKFYKTVEHALGKNIKIRLRVPFFIVASIANLNGLLQKMCNIKSPLDSIEKAREVTALNWACCTDKIQSQLHFVAQHSLNEIID